MCGRHLSANQFGGFANITVIQSLVLIDKKVLEFMVVKMENFPLERSVARTTLASATMLPSDILGSCVNLVSLCIHFNCQDWTAV
jgi:hypothetical protein